VRERGKKERTMKKKSNLEVVPVHRAMAAAWKDGNTLASINNEPPFSTLPDMSDDEVDLFILDNARKHLVVALSRIDESIERAKRAKVSQSNE
jgi:hypothetical protein